MTVEKNIALWSKECQISRDDTSVPLKAIVYKDSSDRLHGQIQVAGHVIYENQFIDKPVESVKSTFNVLFEAEQVQAEREGFTVSKMKELPSFSYYVMRYEPYFGRARYSQRGIPLEEALKAFASLEPAYGNSEKQPLNVLGVEYSLPDISGASRMYGGKYLGCCDLLHERYDNPLRLLSDYKVFAIKDFEEVSVHAIGRLQDALIGALADRTEHAVVSFGGSRKLGIEQSENVLGSIASMAENGKAAVGDYQPLEREIDRAGDVR